MSLHRFDAKRDQNEKDIIETLKRLGCSVAPLSGSGIPDLLVSVLGELHLAEVKTEKGTHTRNQVIFAAAWPTDIATLRSVHDAINWVSDIRGLKNR